MQKYIIMIIMIETYTMVFIKLINHLLIEINYQSSVDKDFNRKISPNEIISIHNTHAQP